MSPTQLDQRTEDVAAAATFVKKENIIEFSGVIWLTDDGILSQRALLYVQSYKFSLLWII